VSERLYGELAEWWPVLVPREVYAPECQEILGLARAVRGQPARSWLELGSATGALASHLPRGVRATLVDLSPQMLALSRRSNPRAEHVRADLREADLGRRFDIVLLHDTLMYMRSQTDLRAAMRSVARHLAPDGVALVIPDVVAETFEEGHVAGGGESPDGRAARLLEWHWQPEPGSGTYQAEMSLLLRAPGEPVVAVHESHTMGLFSRRAIRAAMKAAGLVQAQPPRRYRKAWPELFLGRPAR
jgi:SAM-dependent methyltransferase